MVRQTITEKTDVLTFGKFKDKTIEYVISRQPSYLLWLDSEGIVSFSEKVLDEAVRSDMSQTPPEDFFYQPD